jgi:transcription initiation factor TFIIIB Brf1 subunit/transcription initiation factor TFIIB
MSVGTQKRLAQLNERSAKLELTPATMHRAMELFSNMMTPGTPRPEKESALMAASVMLACCDRSSKRDNALIAEAFGTTVADMKDAAKGVPGRPPCVNTVDLTNVVAAALRELGIQPQDESDLRRRVDEIARRAVDAELADESDTRRGTVDATEQLLAKQVVVEATRDAKRAKTSAQ